jgi:type IV pilus assembly protein PilM
MAHKAVGVDIGSRYVKVVELMREGERARVTACAAQAIADSSEAAKADAVARAVRQAGIRGRRVIGDVGRADAVVKSIRLPATERETVRKLLEFEAQQHVPFPLEEMAWDFSVDEGGPVLLAAVRKASLDSARSVLAQAGLRPSAVSVSSAAAVAAYQQDAGGAPPLDKLGAGSAGEPAGDAGAETAVLIELGAGPVVVNIFCGRRWLLSRALAMTGDDLTTAFAADLGCEVAEAETIRACEGMAAVPAEAPAVAEWIEMLRAETERSLLAAADQTATLTVQRVGATGGGWLTPGLLQAVSGVLGHAVQAVPAAAAATSPPAAAAGETMPMFGTAIGLALQGLGLARGINLMSSAAISARKQARRSIGTVAAMAALVIALGMGAWRYWTLEQRSLALQPARAAAARREAEMQTLRARQREMETQLAEVKRLLAPRHQVLNALQELSAVAPTGIWLTSVSYAPGRPVAVQGKAVSAARLSDLINALGARAALAHMKQGAEEVDFAITMQAASSPPAAVGPAGRRGGASGLAARGGG